MAKRLPDISIFAYSNGWSTIISMESPVDFHVIDDNAPIVEFSVAALESEGYRCCGFTSPVTYLEQLVDGTVRLPKCVITDIQMPGMNGRDLMSEIIKMNGDQRFIVMTGYAAEPFERHDACVYLVKPFHVEGLLDAARTMVHCATFGPSSESGCDALGDSGQFVTEWQCPLDCRNSGGETSES